jgi:hypothetical protein
MRLVPAVMRGRAATVLAGAPGGTCNSSATAWLEVDSGRSARAALPSGQEADEEEDVAGLLPNLAEVCVNVLKRRREMC